jgi:hypothetical protein
MSDEFIARNLRQPWRLSRGCHHAVGPVASFDDEPKARYPNSGNSRTAKTHCAMAIRLREMGETMPVRLRAIAASLHRRMERHRGTRPRGAGIRSVMVVLALGAGSAASVTVSGAAASASQDAKSANLSINVLSGRANAIAGGEALVRIEGSDAAQATVTLNGNPVTSIQPRPDGTVEGLVQGLVLGKNMLKAQAKGAGSDVVQITNYPQQGPIFSGPHQEPFICQNQANGLAAPTDADCSAPATFSYFYKSTSGTFKAYDPSNPPADVSTITVNGQTVPYIVRVESGVINRGVYRIAVIYNPNASWSPWSPQSTWGKKLVLTFGGGCGDGHVQSTLDASSVLLDVPLQLGYAVASSSLMAMGTDCNATPLVETAYMVKQHFIDDYGAPRFTMGNGCSGGSLAQMTAAVRYPGIIDAMNRQCAFQDFNSLQWQVQFDCSLLRAYYQSNSAGWTSAQIDAVEGRSAAYCAAQAGTENVYRPTRGDGGFSCPSTIPQSLIYDPVTNPAGIRCTWQDTSSNIMGFRPRNVWTAPEVAIGHGFANRPIDNVGVEYGLNALKAGTITLDQFIDLNAKIGGRDIDLNPTAARTAADPDAVRRAYANGLVEDDSSLATIPIIDAVGADPNQAFGHEQGFAYVVRARLLAATGTAANDVIWRATSLVQVLSGPIAGSQFRFMDQWLEGIFSDTSNKPLAQKVIDDKPAGLTDMCFDANNQPQPLSYCDQNWPINGAPRTAAGEAMTQDIVKCQLQPLHRGDYPGISDAQWSQLLNIFPTGVCNYTKPSQYAVPFRGPWLTFASGPDGLPMTP